VLEKNYVLEYLIILVIGVFAGFFTGITPGIHPNTVIFVSMPLYFSTDIEFLQYLCFICGLSVSHTFHDFIPSIFLGAPGAETALSSIPGIGMVSEGRGLEAFYYTVLGGLFASTVFVVMAPLLFIVLESIYSLFQGFMEYILLFFLLLIVFSADSFRNSLTIAVLAGFLGIISFSMPVNSQYVLIPVFSGLFAVPSVILAFSSSKEIERQEYFTLDSGKGLRGGITGFFAGLMAGILPGLGAAASTSFLSPLMEDSEEEFLAGMGGVNTSDIMISFVSLFLLDRARSGASVALKSISSVTAQEVVFLIGASLFAISMSVVLAFNSGKYIFSALQRVPIKAVLVIILGVLVSSAFFLTGFNGLLVLFTASCIGYPAMVSEERRACMAVLLVPTIIFFSDYISFM